MQTTWASALAWRLRRHYLDPRGPASVESVVERLVAIPAWSGDPEVAVGMRMATGGPGDLERAQTEGQVIKTFAFRGATHLMTPERAADHLALRAAGRMWERSSWRSHYGLEPEDWPGLREAVREAVSDGPLMLEELATTVTVRPRYRHLHGALSRLDTFLKPFFWQGDVCFGPTRDGEATVQALADNPRWPGIPDLADAGPRAVTAYLAAYAPATPVHVHYWLGEGLGAGRRRIEAWLTGLADRVNQVDVDGETALVLGEHADELAATAPSRSVRLLAAHDQWVLGPGTADPHVVPPARRAEVTRGANVLVVGGVVSGTWQVKADTLTVSPWPLTRLPEEGLADEVARVAVVRGTPLELRVATG